MSTKRVWIVRYGLTEFPLCENLGPYDSDIHPDDGVEHAHCIANAIVSFYSSNSPSEKVTVFASPFLRTVHTGHIIASKLKTKLCIEEGLYEWMTPSLLVVEKTGIRTYPRSVDETVKLFSAEEKGPCVIDATYQTKNSISQDSFPETESALLERCAKTLQLLLHSSSSSKENEDIVIVAHAPCDQYLAFALEIDAKTAQESKLSPWPLGGITMFEKSDNNDGDRWEMKMYGDTNHMPGEYKNGLKEWSLPCFVKK